jgi:hypothetical protein
MLNSQGVVQNFGATPSADWRRARQTMTTDPFAAFANSVRRERTDLYNDRYAFNPDGTSQIYSPHMSGPVEIPMTRTKFNPIPTGKNIPISIRSDMQYQDQSIFNRPQNVRNKLVSDFWARKDLVDRQTAARAAKNAPGQRIKDFFGNIGTKFSNAGRSVRNFFSNLFQRMRPANYSKKAFGMKQRGKKGGRVVKKYKKRRLIK